jgi:hypothetical protein
MSRIPIFWDVTQHYWVNSFWYFSYTAVKTSNHTTDVYFLQTCSSVECLQNTEYRPSGLKEHTEIPFHRKACCMNPQVLGEINSCFGKDNMCITWLENCWSWGRRALLQTYHFWVIFESWGSKFSESLQLKCLVMSWWDVQIWKLNKVTFWRKHSSHISCIYCKISENSHTRKYNFVNTFSVRLTITILKMAYCSLMKQNSMWLDRLWVVIT